MAKHSKRFRAYPESPYRVPVGGGFSVASAPTTPGPDAPGKDQCKKELRRVVERLDESQRVLYAEDRHAVLCIFQAMDASGKDSTIRAVFSGVNPAGFQVFSFKAPSAEELEHDFLWRTACRLPERGRIGVFNRSYYEELLIVRVHPELLASQRLREPRATERFWEHRYQSIVDHEKHLVRNGTVILKFWLNVSPEEQRRRFLDRIRKQEKNWKFSEADVAEREHWPAYMEAYEKCLNATSTRWAPWYAIPADDKPFMRLTVAGILADTLGAMGLRYPEASAAQLAGLCSARRRLEGDD